MENFSIEIRQVINSERIIELQSHHFATSKEWVALATVADGCYTCSQRWTGADRREDQADRTWRTHNLDGRKCRYPHKPKSNWGSGSILYWKFKNPKNVHPKKKDWYAKLRYSSGQKAWCFHTKFYTIMAAQLSLKGAQAEIRAARGQSLGERNQKDQWMPWRWKSTIIHE